MAGVTAPQLERAPVGPRTRTASRVVQALILDAHQRQSLVCVRSLGRSGIRVGALDTRPGAAVFRSRWCTASGVVPDFVETPGAFVDAVLDWTVGAGPQVIVPNHDGSIAALRARRPEVERSVRLALAREDALDLAVDKARTLQLAENLSIPVPRTVTVADPDDVRSAVELLRLPVIVKPAESWVRGTKGGRRLTCSLALTLDEALRMVDGVTEAGGSALLQEWLPGSREAITLFRADGRIRARFAQVAHRTYPPLGGSSVVRESIPLPPDLIAASEQLVDACDLDGCSEIEFRRDADGRPRLMEINPRLSASVELAVRSGIDFPLLLYRWGTGDAVPSIGTYRCGVRMRWLGGDLRTLAETLRSRGRPDVLPLGRALASFVADFARQTSYDYVARDDLTPAVAAAASWLRRRTASVGRRSRGVVSTRSRP